MKNVKVDISKAGVEITAEMESKAQAANSLLHKERKNPTVLFAGQNISEDYTVSLRQRYEKKSTCISLQVLFFQ